MATVTGLLWNFARSPGPGMYPEASLIPSGAATNDGTLGTIFFPAPVPLIIDEYGFFTAEVQANDALEQDIYYTLEVTWFNGAGIPIGYETPPWRFYIPASGGKLTSFMRPSNSGGLFFWVNPGAVIPDPALPGDYLADSNTGILYRLEGASMNDRTKVKVGDFRGPEGKQGPKGDPSPLAVTNDNATSTLLQSGTTTRPTFVAEVGKLAAPGAVLNASRTIVVGDSLTEHFDGHTAQYRDSWFANLHAISDGAIKLTSNAAHSGWGSTQLRNVFDAEVLALDPTLVMIMPGRNDSQSDGTPAEMAVFVREAVAKCRARGIGVVLVNTVPQGRLGLSTPPTVLAELRTGAGGTWPSGVAYSFKVTACSGTAGPNEILGETTVGAATGTTPVVVAGSAPFIKVSWAHVPGANAYRVYRQSGANWLLETTVYPVATLQSETNHHVWLTAPGTPGAPAPTVNTTDKAPSMIDRRARINAWLAKFCAEQGVPLVDIYSKLVSPVTQGVWRVGLTYDGTHPSGEGNYLIGKTIWDSIRDSVKSLPAEIASVQVDPYNLFPDGMLANGVGELPDGWTKTAIPSWDTTNHVTEWLAANSRTGFLGRVIRQTTTVSGFVYSKSPNIIAGFSVGDRILLSAKLEVDAPEGAVQIGICDQAAADFGLVRLAHGVHPVATVSVEAVVPVGTTAIAFRLTALGKATAYVGQITAYNLTTRNWINV